jgi:hypothetical protein
MRKLLIALLLIAAPAIAQMDDDGTWVCQTCPSISQGLVSLWTFNDGTAVDNYGTSNGALSNGASIAWSTGLAGQGVDFDGTNDNIFIADNDTNTFVTTYPTNKAGSISLWIYKDTTNDFNYLAKADNTTAGSIEWALSTISMKPFIGLYDNGTANRATGTSASAIPLATWTHIVYVYNGAGNNTGFTIYINGVLTTTTGGGGGSFVCTRQTASSIRMGVGIVLAASPSWFNGRVDDVRWFSRAVTSTEVTGLYRAGSYLRNIGR